MGNQALPVEIDSSNESLTYADLIIDYLLQIDVEYLFGIPGGAIEPLYNALAKNLEEKKRSIDCQQSFLRLRQRNAVKAIIPVIARHEAGAAFMADGYARETGRLGVCCATTGPGATNLITGVATAYANRIPMLVITPQTALPNFGRRSFQESSSEEVDIVGMFEHCTRYNTLVSHRDQLASKLYTALMTAYHSPRGPVHISIPMDILRANIPSNMINQLHFQVGHLLRQPKSYDVCAFNYLERLFQQGKENVFLLGGGCQTAMDEILKFAELTNTLITTTPSAKGLMNPYHPLYRGVCGFAGHVSAIEAITDQQTDHLIAVGTSLGEMSTCSWNSKVINEKLIHVCSSSEDFVRSPMASLHLLGNIQKIFEDLYRSLKTCQINIINNHDKDDAIKKNSSLRLHRKDYIPNDLSVSNREKIHSDTTPLKPQRVIYELASRIQSDTRVIVDVGNAWAWVTHYMMLDSIKNLRMEFSFGAMGWAIGAAIGTAYGSKGKPVISITGDGSYLMNGQELTVAVTEQLPIIFIILNDSSLGMIKHGQRMTGAKEIGYALPRVDFTLMAKAVGARSYAIRAPADFKYLDMENLLSAPGPVLIDIHIDADETPPIGVRIKGLESV